MRDLRLVWFVVIALGLTGCTNVAQRANRATLLETRGRTIALTERKATDFADTKLSKSMLGSLGGAVGGVVAHRHAVATGKEYLQKFGLADPAIRIGTLLGEQMAREY